MYTISYVIYLVLVCQTPSTTHLKHMCDLTEQIFKVGDIVSYQDSQF